MMNPDTIDNVETRRRLRERLAVAVGGGDDSGSGDSGPNWPDPKKNEFFDGRLDDEDDQDRDKSRVVTWFLLVIVLMTFGGLIGAYVVIATNNVLEWRPFALPTAVWVSTILILLSSITYHLAKTAVDASRQGDARKWFIATTVLGAMFISSQLIAWFALSTSGILVYGNPYAGFFYILTGVHAVHVLGGIVALGAVLLRSWNDTSAAKEVEYRRNLARSVGWYWHFMGVLWLVLFVLLGFWT